MYVAACVLVFFLAYALTIMLTSIGYHRALCHGSVQLRPWARRALLQAGPWLTGFDAKSWVVMHRMHHLHSDTPEDPHSPVNVGLRGIFKAQLDSFVKVQEGLLRDDPHYTVHGRDLELSWMLRSGLWFGPVVVHAVTALAVALTFGWWLGIALFAGTMSHVVQGAIINYFGHAHGGRNFEIPDNSRNHHGAAWLVLGEGFQNNHHRYPTSARFSYQPAEIDMGYGVCRVLQFFRVLHIVQWTLMPRPPGPLVPLVPLPVQP